MDIITKIFHTLSEQQKKRINNTKKEFILFQLSIFNTGLKVEIKCTNKYNYKNNGYELITFAKDIKGLLQDFTNKEELYKETF